jgi:hypothetical protein
VRPGLVDVPAAALDLLGEVPPPHNQVKVSEGTVMDIVRERADGMHISKREGKVCLRVPGPRTQTYTSTVTTWDATTQGTARRDWPTAAAPGRRDRGQSGRRTCRQPCPTAMTPHSGQPVPLSPTCRIRTFVDASAELMWMPATPDSTYARVYQRPQEEEVVQS